MRNDYTHVCIVLDASGSMETICNDVKGSFNSFLEKQRTAPGKTVFDLFQFAFETERLVKSVDLSTFQKDLMAGYCCKGGTALHDAVCTAIDTLGREFAAMPEEERPAHVIFAIITDGEENSSLEFTLDDVKERITHQQEVYKWEFVFLAANQDAFTAGTSLGISAQNCCSYSMNSESFEEDVTLKLCQKLDALRMFELPDDDDDILTTPKATKSKSTKTTTGKTKSSKPSKTTKS